MISLSVLVHPAMPFNFSSCVVKLNITEGFTRWPSFSHSNRSIYFYISTKFLHLANPMFCVTIILLPCAKLDGLMDARKLR